MCRKAYKHSAARWSVAGLATRGVAKATNELLPLPIVELTHRAALTRLGDPERILAAPDGVAFEAMARPDPAIVAFEAMLAQPESGRTVAVPAG